MKIMTMKMMMMMIQMMVMMMMMKIMIMMFRAYNLVSMETNVLSSALRIEGG